MAVFQSIQRHPVLLASVLGGGLILMIIMFGFDDYNGLFQGDRDTVLSVNGKKVSWAQFETERQRQSDFFQSFYNQDVNKAEISHQINNQIYSQCVQDILLDEQLEQLGIAVSDAEVNELAQGSHISPVLTQIFGQNAQTYGQTFAQLVSNNGFEEFQQQYNAPYMTLNNWLVIEHQIKSTRKAQKYSALLNAAIQPNKLEAQDVFNGENTDVSFSYVRKRASEVADSLVSVSSSDLKAYYENHKESFKQNQQTREIVYVAVPLYPSEDDRNATLANLQNALPEFTNGDVKEVVAANSQFSYVDAFLNDNTFRGELKEFVEANAAGAVSEPKIYSGDIFTLLGEQSENDESLSEYYWMARIMAKQTAPDSLKLVIAGATKENQDSLFTEIKKGSQDSLAQWTTDLATINYEAGLRAKIASAKKGDTFKYDFNNGQQDIYLVVKVVDETQKVPQSKVAIYAEKINPSSKTRRTEYGRLNEFINDNPSIQQMQDSALAKGFRLLNADVASNSYNINQVKECRQAVRFVFEGKTGDISEIYEDGGYLLVVGITGEIEQGYATLDNKNVADYMRMQVKPRKQIEYLVKNDFANVADKSSLEGYSSALGVGIQEATRVNFNMNSISGLGIEPKVIAEALKNAEGTIVGPIEGNSNAVIIKVGAKTDKGLTFNEQEYKDKVMASAYRNASGLASQQLNNAAEITDNRIRFY